MFRVTLCRIVSHVCDPNAGQELRNDCVTHVFVNALKMSHPQFIMPFSDMSAASQQVQTGAQNLYL